MENSKTMMDEMEKVSEWKNSGILRSDETFTLHTASAIDEYMRDNKLPPVNLFQLFVEQLKIEKRLSTIPKED